MTVEIAQEEIEPTEIRRLRDNGIAELAAHFSDSRELLKQMIAQRLDSRLRGRADASDIVQDTFIEASRRLPDYLESPNIPPKKWLYQVGRQVLSVHYRDHAGTAKRAVSRETTHQSGTSDSGSTNGELAESNASPHSQIARAELTQRVMDLVESMSQQDCEILSLKQLQQLTFEQVANQLDLTVEAAKKRYQRALLRLGQIAGHLQDRSTS